MTTRTRKYRQIRVQPTHSLAGKTGRVSEARARLFDKIGWGPHPCHWCSKPINWLIGVRGNHANAIIADHVDGNALNDDIENLVPSCGTCNHKRVRKVQDHEQFITLPSGRRVRAISKVCVGCQSSYLVM